MTTHYMEEAEALCDRVGIIQGGQLLAMDTLTNLRAGYGFQFKVTYHPNGPLSEPESLFGSDDQELVIKMQEMSVQQFSLGPTNLEDVYLAMTGDTEGFGGHGD